MRLTGAEIVVECILEQGIDTVFGIPGGTILPVYDALNAAQERVTHILNAHEQSAAHAADGYARASGRPGVCVVTGGPGATNLCTGIAAAYMDSIPMVCITGNIPAGRMGTDSFQEIDIVGMTIPITKHNYQVKSIESVADILREAFSLAVSGRPGPVLVDVAMDVMGEYTDYQAVAPAPASAAPTLKTDLTERLRQAKAPLLLAGGGVIRAGAESLLVELAERLDAPVVTTLMGLTAMPASHPLFAGMIGLHGHRPANLAMTRADLLIAVGTRFSDRSMGGLSHPPKHLPVIHIDIDRAEIGKNIPSEQFLVGDARWALESMLRAEPQKHPEWHDWLSAKREDAKSVPLNYAERLIAALGRMAGPDALICTDVGQHQMWCAQHIRFEKPGRFITSGGAGAMGYGLGAAIGAQCACPEKTVVLVTGDGSFQMNLCELSTVARNRLPITIVVVNNGALGMIRQLQTLFYGNRFFANELSGAPDFVRLAAAYNIHGVSVSTVEDFTSRFGEALDSRRPALIDCRVPIDAKVYQSTADPVLSAEG